MAEVVEQIGDPELTIVLEFADREMREDFEIAFRAWSKQYKQDSFLSALMKKHMQDEKAVQKEGDDTAGFIFAWSTYTSKNGVVHVQTHGFKWNP